MPSRHGVPATAYGDSRSHFTQHSDPDTGVASTFGNARNIKGSDANDPYGKNCKLLAWLIIIVLVYNSSYLFLCRISSVRLTRQRPIQ